MHEPQAAIQAGLAIPGLEAGTSLDQCRSIGPQVTGAHAEQVRHHLVSQINLVVHDHALQILHLHRPVLGQLAHPVQCKTRPQSQRLTLLADQRGVTGQRLRRVDHPGRIVGVLHIITAQQLRKPVGGIDAFLHGFGIDAPGTLAARAIQHDQSQPGPGIAAPGQFVGVDVRHHRHVHVKALPLVVHRQGIDPGNALNLMDGVLQILERDRLVHGVPLGQHAIVFQVRVPQAVGEPVIPVQPARPLHDRAEL